MSIRRYLVLTLFAVLTLITFIAAIQGYQLSMKQSGKQFDQQLKTMAQTLAVLPFTTVETTPITSSDLFALQVWKNGKLLFRSTNAPSSMMIEKEQGLKSGFSLANFSRQRWRTYTILESEYGYVIIVAQPLTIRFTLTENIILTAVSPMILAVVLLSVLIYIIVTQGLKPLVTLNDELSHRNANDFSQLKFTAKHSELIAVKDTLNQLFKRLKGAYEREKYFASDAAHELKTPLSVLKLNVHNLSEELKTQTDNNVNIAPLISSVERMGHLIDQILMLNRLNPELIAQERNQVAIQPLLQEVISDLYAEINNKHQTIELNTDAVDIIGHHFALKLLFINLITNASKYTPEFGSIRVSTFEQINSKKNTSMLSVCIEDSGPGINKSEYERVFDRFYRVGGDHHNSNVSGCGLGLTIVKHIVDLHKGSICLDQSIELQGLSVTVNLILSNKDEH